MGSFFVSLSRLYQASCLLRLRMASPAKPSRRREAGAGSVTKYADMDRVEMEGTVETLLGPSSWRSTLLIETLSPKSILPVSLFADKSSTNWPSFQEIAPETVTVSLTPIVPKDPEDCTKSPLLSHALWKE